MEKLNLADFLTAQYANFSLNIRKVENGVVVSVNNDKVGNKEYVFSGTADEIKPQLVTFGLGEFVA